MDLFLTQVDSMRKANTQIRSVINSQSKTVIGTRSILRIRPTKPFVDLIISSPPYVTSYEYADLHQLSTLWLGFVDDYRDLRSGTIGSDYGKDEKLQNYILNNTGTQISQDLKKVDASKSNSVIKYFRDINKTISQTNKILNPGGSAAFLIGNTSYKGITINNAKFLSESLLQNGFSQVKLIKRRISLKILTPFRNKLGQFSTDCTCKKVYSHEYLIIGEKSK